VPGPLKGVGGGSLFNDTVEGPRAAAVNPGRIPSLKHDESEGCSGTTGGGGRANGPAGLSTLVCAYVVDRSSASPYTYSSSTHRFPDERTPIEVTPLSATSAELGFGLGLGLGLGSLTHFSSHALPRF
jgi:hypothetical protein